MKSIKNWTFFFISVLFLLQKTNAQPGMQTQTGNAFLQIQCEQTGVEIVIDRKSRGKTPLPILSITPGNHSITALNPRRFLWGQFDWHKEISLAPAETLQIKIEFPEVITIRSYPDEAEVFLNDEFIGETPLYFTKRLTPGTKFTLRKKNYFPETITFDGRYPAFYNIRLTRNEQEYQRQLFMQNLERKKHARYRRASYGLWAASLFSGLTSIYFKQEANKNYKNYQNSASLIKMNQYFDNSLKYDNISNISLGIFQSTFWLSLYMLYKSYH